jgi:hypothetical protein
MLGRQTTFHSLATQSANSLTAGDELFFNLDSSDLRVDGESWRVEVCGIHSDGADHWVQANLHGFVNYSVTLRADELDAAEVRSTLISWLPGAPLPGDDPAERIVSVATA